MLPGGQGEWTGMHMYEQWQLHCTSCQGEVDAAEWACVPCGHHIQNERVEQWNCVKFCTKLEHSSSKTIWMIQRAAAMGTWWLAALPQQCACSCIMSHAEFFVKQYITQVTQPTYCQIWHFVTSGFPKTTITFEREEILDHLWDSEKYDRAADGNWENSGRSQGTYVEGDWGVIVLCTVSCILYLLQ